MAAAAILNFLKSVATSFFWTDPHQIWWECCESDIECNRFIKSAFLPKFKMADAAILNFENIDLLSIILGCTRGIMSGGDNVLLNSLLISNTGLLVEKRQILM